MNVSVRRPRPFDVFGAVAGLIVLVYLLDLSDAVSSICFALLALGTVGAVLVAPRLHHLRRALPWRLVAAGCVAFCVGATLRPLAQDAEGVVQALPDLFTVPGYVLTAAGMVTLFDLGLKALDVHAMADGVIVALGAAMVAVTFLALPAAQIPGRPAWLAVLAALYPVFDVLLLLILVQIAFTRRTRYVSFRLIAVCLAFLFAGDTGYAVIGRSGQLVGPHWLDGLFAVGYLALGLAALHPSATLLATSETVHIQAWSRSRLALLVPALAVPSVVMLVDGAALRTRITLATGAALIVAALVVRSVAAVHGYARSQEVFRHQATHDALTGLPNRTLLAELLDEALTAARRRPTVQPGARTHLLFLDLDGFKLVNDSWGHDLGDELLLAVAERLVDCTPDGATVARIGGDEFLVALLSQTDDRAGERLADVLLDRMRHPFRLSLTEVIITTSVGVALSEVDGSSTADSLIGDADTAMYRAKAAGRQQWAVFDPSMRAAVRSRVELELALRHALVDGQLEVHYQPVVRLSDESVDAAEALLRWHHPVLGQVGPSDFIPVAEESGLISELGDWVVQRALDQVLAWRAHPGRERMSVSVNVSGRQLRDPEFATRVGEALARRGLDGAALCVEITESAALEDTVTVAGNLDRLHAGGVRLAIDDFGTGYSSLSYLRRLPLDEVKIDRSFVAGMGAHEEDAEIVRAAVAMAHALGLTVVAEGVETTAQRDRLRLLGVDRAQGWLFGRPGPGDALPRGAGSNVLSPGAGSVPRYP